MPSSDYSLSYEEATRVDCDRIFEQTEYAYDAAGNVISVVSRQRLHDAVGTGPLTTPAGSQPKARVSYAATWYDPIGRQKAAANYGTNDGTAPTRPSAAPASSDTILVSTTDYNARGEAFKTTDPAGREDRSFFDDAGRGTKTVQNYVDGVVSAATPDEDVTVETTYNADGLVSTLTAKNPTTGDQVTRYVYGTATGGITPKIYRNDLLRAEIYPDSDDTTGLTDGVDGIYDRVEMKYNRQGQLVEKKDQNQTVHAFSYDALGRLIEDEVTAFGATVDHRVVAIGRSYEVRGMLETITSYGTADSSSSSSLGDGRVVLNQVQLEYDDLGRLEKDYQEHDGAKDGNTLYVEYNYPDFATSGLRLESFRYPNGRKTHFDYSSTDGSALNRLDAIRDDNAGSPGSTLARYTYLGLGTMVVEDFVQPQVKLDYFGGASGSYAGFDRFGRVIDQKWYDYGAGVVRDQYTYGHDRASNRLYRENTTTSAKDEYYTYDGVNRLVGFDRGDLDAGKTAISGTPAREQEFTLDATGNWSDFVVKTAGSTDLNQSRTHNAVNELTDITETQGTAWLAPEHDRAGNMTVVPKPSDLANGLDCTYDAWSRLVQVADAVQSTSSSTSSGETAVVIAKYEYDGRGRRVKKHVDSQSPGSPNGVDTYEHHFYLGVQLVETRETGTETAEPEDIQPQYQYVWSSRYIDAPILRDKNADADGLCDDGRLYYLTDANFNVTALVDTAGDAVECYGYDPYGTVTVYDGAWTGMRSASSYDNSVLFTGRELDVETGLYYYRARYYDSALGRFVARDAIGYELSKASLYCYCGNRPVDGLDPLGLWDINRAGESKADATTEDGDTIVALAQEIGLDSGEFRKWLTIPNSLNPITLVNRSTVSPNDKNLDRLPLCAGQTFRIPNTMVSIWLGEGKGAGKTFVGWWGDNEMLGKLGFKVSILDMESSAAVLGRIAALSSGRELHGLFITGHGSRTGFGTGGTSNWFSSQIWVRYVDVKNRLNYTLAAVIINACYGDSRSLVSSGGTTAGGRDLVSSNGIFVGDPGTFYPVVDAQSMSEWDPITGAEIGIWKPGDQGTNELEGTYDPLLLP